MYTGFLFLLRRRVHVLIYPTTRAVKDHDMLSKNVCCSRKIEKDEENKFSFLVGSWFLSVHSQQLCHFGSCAHVRTCAQVNPSVHISIRYFIHLSLQILVYICSNRKDNFRFSSSAFISYVCVGEQLFVFVRLNSKTHISKRRPPANTSRSTSQD